jgi:hypothetical protein
MIIRPSAKAQGLVVASRCTSSCAGKPAAQRRAIGVQPYRDLLKLLRKGVVLATTHHGYSLGAY